MFRQDNTAKQILSQALENKGRILDRQRRGQLNDDSEKPQKYSRVKVRINGFLKNIILYIKKHEHCIQEKFAKSF